MYMHESKISICHKSFRNKSKKRRAFVEKTFSQTVEVYSMYTLFSQFVDVIYLSTKNK